MGTAWSLGYKREGSPVDISSVRPPQIEVDEDSSITQDPSGESMSEGTRTPSSASGLTPRGSPSCSRRSSTLTLDGLHPSPRPANRRSKEYFPDPTRRRSSAADAMKAKVLVKTGDQEKSGTDANVYIQLEDDNGHKTSKLKLDLPFYDDLERGNLDTYSLQLPEGFHRVVKLHLSRDSKGMGNSWFCDYVIVQDPRFAILTKHRKIKKTLAPGVITSAEDLEGPKAEYYFPIHRWVSHSHQYEFEEFGCSLPQFDCCPTPRKEDLEEKRNVYKYCIKIPGGPAQVDKLPSDEKFSDEYFWTFAGEKAKLITQTKFVSWSTTKWNSFNNFVKVFKNFKQSLGEPPCVDVWTEDRWFGLQRVMGTNCVVIELCKEIPNNLDVTNDIVENFLEGLSLEEALEQNRIFICNLKLLDGLQCKDDRVLCAPMVLFFLNDKKDLMPVAIQLMQSKGPDNPVFTPDDPPNTWLVAKMYYNNAEAQHHQGITHLGRTHILMEGLCVCTHRNLSPSHPLFKLLAPHFLYLLAINYRGLEKLVSLGGWVDRCMTQGVKGIFTLISLAVSSWQADKDGVPEEELRQRGVLDPKILPNYPYRDDIIPLYAALKKYVTTVLEHHYDTPTKIVEDFELQRWRQEMVTPTDKQGVGMSGVPGDHNGFTNVSQVIDITTTIIATCSLGHASSNFQQYAEYAFVPNYPGILMEPPPTVKKDYTEQEMLALLPNKCMTLDIVLITKLLSKRGTKSLGDFEMQYMYDPVGVQAAQELRTNLAKISLEIKMRNLDREFKYETLDPEFVPNSISV
uniref:Lipoxygenase n=1 Tax=Hirondellea gigas TaxID=1518452 RepID=A0A6A7FU73_9CRUS